MIERTSVATRRAAVSIGLVIAMGVISLFGAMNFNRTGRVAPRLYEMRASRSVAPLFPRAAIRRVPVVVVQQAPATKSKVAYPPAVPK